MIEKRSLLALALAWCGVAGLAAAAEPDLYDLFHNDDTSATLNWMTTNIPQAHTIHEPLDVDWAIFFAEAGLPYSVKIRDAGADLDAALEVFLDGPDQPGFLVNFAALGGDETFTRQSWPATGFFWLRVWSPSPATGATSYTLTVTQNTGANNGLATISGWRIRLASAGPDLLSLPDLISVDGVGQVMPLYTLKELSFESGAFDAGSPTTVLLSGMGDPIHHLQQPWVAQWLAAHPGNLTITRVGLSPSVQPMKALRLGLQLRATPATLTLSDGAIALPERVYQDAPAADTDLSVTVYRWNPQSGRWEVYDEAPELIPLPDGLLAVISIPALQLSLASSDLFAAAVGAPPHTCSKKWWTVYL